MNPSNTLMPIYRKMVKALPLPLAKSEKDLVPAEGKQTAKVIFIGEAPGFQESVERRPFVGRSGQLLRKTLKALEILDDEIYISNIVKARPPENRDPTPAEIAAYQPFLDEEIETIQPLLIVTLGRFSMNKFMPEVKISQVHGRLHRVNWHGQSLYILPMYHPAAALRGTAMNKAFIADFEKLPKVVKWIEAHNETEKMKESVKEILF